VVSVASFFLSRIDSAVDKLLEKLDSKDARSLQGKIAIANAKVTYQRFLETLSGERWERLAALGAQAQRVLWASTSTKNPAYPDTMYVDELIGPDTVNTIPPVTMQAFLDHGTVNGTVTEGLEGARGELALLAELGIDLDAVTQQLQEEGVEKFVKPFSSLFEAIAAKVEGLQRAQTVLEARLGDYQDTVDTALATIKSRGVMGRIWAHDHTLWDPDSEEIANRLGWLHSPEVLSKNLDRIQDLLESVRADGYRWLHPRPSIGHGRLQPGP